MKSGKKTQDEWDRFQNESALMLVLAFAGVAVLIVSVKLVFFP